MTRERDRWYASITGTRQSFSEHYGGFTIISRLHRDWDRFVEISLNSEEAEELAKSLKRFMDDRAEQTADQST
jgi:23S rRNA A2030 N6-methylase RlmJ